MSYVNIKNLPYIGGFLELCRSNTLIFKDTKSNDIILYTDWSDQNICLGTNRNSNSAIRISSNSVYVQSAFSIEKAVVIGSSNYPDYRPYERFMVIGDSNWPANLAFYDQSQSNPLYYQKHMINDTSLSFDSFWDGSNWLASDSNSAVFQIAKSSNLFSVRFSNSNTNGSIIWQDALTINSNGNILLTSPSFAMSDVYQQLNLKNQITQTYDAMFSNNLWISSVDTAFQIAKQSNVFQINMGFSSNNFIDQWQTAFQVTPSNIGILTSNPVYTLDIAGSLGFSNKIYCNGKEFNPSQWSNTESNQVFLLGSNIGINMINETYDTLVAIAGSMSFFDSNYAVPVLELRNQVNNMSLLFDASSGASNAFEIQKEENALAIKVSSNVNGVLSDWVHALIINNQGMVGIGAGMSNPQFNLDIVGSINFGNKIYNNGKEFNPSQWSNTESNQVFLLGSNVGIGMINETTDNLVTIAGSLAFFDPVDFNAPVFSMFQSNLNTSYVLKYQSNNSHITFTDHIINLQTSNTYLTLDSKAQDLQTTAALSVLGKPVNFDCFYDSNAVLVSSSDSGNFQFVKEFRSFVLYTACNIPVGSNLPQPTSAALTVTDNGIVAFGKLNTAPIPSFKLSLHGPSYSVNGPNLACYIEDDPANPVFQIFNDDKDHISQSFGCYWDGFNWVSSTSNGAFKLAKEDGQFLIQSSIFGYVSSNINNSWINSICVNSNSFVGIRTDHPTMALDVGAPAVFRSNVYFKDDLLPFADQVQSLGASNRRFKDLYLSGNSLYLNDLALKRDAYTGGLLVYDNFYQEPARIWAKEIMIGDPTNAENDSVLILKASSNGLQFNNVASNLPPQPFTQFNCLYVTPDKVGIAIKNPEKILHVQGDTEINPLHINPVYWTNNVMRLEAHAYPYPGFQGTQGPKAYSRGGFHNGPTVRFDRTTPISYSNPLNLYTAGYEGFTALAMIRFNSIVDTQHVFQFSNNTDLLEFGSSNNNAFFQTKDTHLNAGPIINLSEWALFTIRYTQSNETLEILKNNAQTASSNFPIMSNMSFAANEITFGQADMDVSTFYMFDRALTDTEMDALSSLLLTPGHHAFIIKSKSQPYPPDEFTASSLPFVPAGKRNGGQVYEKRLANLYYGNGLYRVWANTEIEPAWAILDSDLQSGWKTLNNTYNNQSSVTNVPTVYFELPSDILLTKYALVSSDIDPTMSPTSWKIYSSVDARVWALIDSRDNQGGPDTAWSLTEERIFEVSTVANGRYFKLEIYQNDSASDNYIGFNDFRLYGNENMLGLDGSGLAINTSLPTERLTVDGGALITGDLRVGELQNQLHPNIFEYPPMQLTGASNNIQGLSRPGNGLYVVAQSAGNGWDGFNPYGTTLWRGQPNAYDTVTGIYTANAFTTLIAGVPRRCDYLELKLPEPILLKAYKIIADTNSSAPKVLYVAGSYDNGVTWVELDFQNAPTQDATQLYFLNSPVSCQHFRLLPVRIGTTAGRVAIKQWALYAEMNVSEGFGASHLQVQGDLTVNNRLSIGTKEKIAPVWDLTCPKLGTVLTQGSLVTQWESFSQPTIHYQPRYDSDWVHFSQNTYLQGGRGIIYLYSGFTLSLYVKFAGLSGASDIINFDNTIKITQDGADVIFSVGADQLRASNVLINQTWKFLMFRVTQDALRLQILDEIGVLARMNRTELASTYTYTESQIGPASMDLSSIRMFMSATDDKPQNIALDVFGDIRMTGGIRGAGLQVFSDTYTNVVLEFPPLPLTAKEAMITQSPYGNGIYKASASVNEDTVYNAFNNIGWSFTASVGAYLVANNTTYPGDWVQLDIPQLVRPVSYQVEASGAITGWVLCGSPDALVWDMLHIQNSPTNNIIHLTPTETGYSHYRIIFSGGSGTITRTRIFGNTQATLGTCQNRTLVLGSLSVGTIKDYGGLTIAGHSYPDEDALYNLGSSNLRYNQFEACKGRISGSNPLLSFQNDSNIVNLTYSNHGLSLSGKFYGIEALLQGALSFQNGSNIVSIGYSNHGLSVSDNLYVQQDISAVQAHLQGPLSFQNDSNIVGLSYSNHGLSVSDNLYVQQDISAVHAHLEGSNPLLSFKNDSNIVNLSYREQGLSVSGNFFVDEHTTLYNSLTVYNTTMLSNLEVAGMINMYSDMAVYGNTGLGTNTPRSRLHIVGDLTIEGNIILKDRVLGPFYGIEVNKDAGPGYNTVTGVGGAGSGGGGGFGGAGGGNIPGFVSTSNSLAYIFTSNSSFILVNPSNVEVIRFTDIGYLGLNTSDPKAMLHVNGTTLISGQVLTLSNNNNPFMLLENGSGVALWGLASSNNVFSTNAVPGDMIFKSYTGNKLILQSGNSAGAIIINNNNYVGINKPNPQCALDIIGDVNITGALYQNGLPFSPSLLNSNVGIGTSNPESILHIMSTQSNVLLFENASQSFALGLSNNSVWTISTSNTSLAIKANTNIIGSLSKTTGTFDIPHPDPKKPDYRLRHSFVESPTAGDNIYRYQVKTMERKAFVQLPDYFNKLNTNAQAWITAENVLGYGMAKVIPIFNRVDIEVSMDGVYNILVIGTRKDKDAVANWEILGDEYHV